MSNMIGVNMPPPLPRGAVGQAVGESGGIRTGIKENGDHHRENLHQDRKALEPSHLKGHCLRAVRHSRSRQRNFRWQKLVITGKEEAR